MNRVTRQVMRHAARSSHVMLATGIGDAPPAPGMRWIHATAITEAEVAGFHPDLDRPARRPLRLAWAGRLSGEKGVAELRAACHLLAADPPPGGMPELVIAGDGPERGPLAADLEPIMPGRVRFLGQLDRQALLGTLAEADLLVLPSRTEAFAKARLDAMLAGTPVLTTPVGGGRELVGPDGCRGWVVPARDAEALADRLRRLASEQLEWPGLRRRCRAFAEPFTLEEWRDRIGELCEAAWGRGLRSGDGAGR